MSAEVAAPGPSGGLVEGLAGITHVLAIQQPWATLTVEGPRRYHNMASRPPTVPLGQRVAVYAAAKPDVDGAGQAIALLAAMGISRAVHSRWATRTVRGAIIGTAVFAGITTAADDPWFVGPFAVWLTDGRALKEPVPMADRAGMWRLA